MPFGSLTAVCFSKREEEQPKFRLRTSTLERTDSRSTLDRSSNHHITKGIGDRSAQPGTVVEAVFGGKELETSGYRIVFSQQKRRVSTIGIADSCAIDYCSEQLLFGTSDLTQSA